MVQVSVVQRFEVPADRVWQLLVDVRNHARWIPLTRVETDGPPVPGCRIVAISGPGARQGRAGLVDRMHITRADPPAERRLGVATFVKDGPLLRGTATIEVAPDGDQCLVRWSEQVHLTGPMPRLTAALLAPAFAVMLRVALGRATREVAGQG